MINLAEALAGDTCFLRVDLYNICGSIKFGELTFYPAGEWACLPILNGIKNGGWLKLPFDKHMI